jgi:16S rRNA (guanine527-N7)-methyltransferase
VLRGLGSDGDAPLRAAIEAHVRLLLAWNAAINLTAIRDPAAVALEHVADSLAAVPVLGAAHVPPRPALVDIGSGGGFPGLPLAHALGARRALLLDSVAKKARFLAVAAAAAATASHAAGGRPPRILAEAARAETVARRTGGRESFHVVTVRAVGPLLDIAELALPLARVGGVVAAWKRDDGSGALDAEMDEARALIGHLGGAPPAVEATGVPDLEDHRLVLIGKRGQTPAAFPRPPGDRASRRRRRG